MLSTHGREVGRKPRPPLLPRLPDTVPCATPKPAACYCCREQSFAKQSLICSKLDTWPSWIRGLQRCLILAPRLQQQPGVHRCSKKKGKASPCHSRTQRSLRTRLPAFTLIPVCMSPAPPWRKTTLGYSTSKARVLIDN